MACIYKYKGKNYTQEEFNSLLDEQFLNQSKTRILYELQSDLFQKGRDKDDLITSLEGYGYSERVDYSTGEQFYQVGRQENMGEVLAVFNNKEDAINFIKENEKQDKIKKENQFLQLLNKDNNWVTFFIKSIIQDTAKQTITEIQESDVEAKVKELEREGLLEIDCKGKLKAEKGLQTNFTKGGKWKLIKDLKGYPTHKEGGIDLTIGKNGVSIKNGNTEFIAKHGLVIPKN